jgi:amino acid permease
MPHNFSSVTILIQETLDIVLISHGCRVISNFAFSFAIISILTGITTLFNTGLTYGGTISMVYGWLIVGFFTMFVGLAMGEICSAFPTSGGLYYWSSQLAGPEWGPFASWITGWYAISHASKRRVLQICHFVVYSFVTVFEN